MKKVKVLAASLLASVLFISCSNDTETIVDTTPKQVSVLLNLPRLASTKGLNDITSDTDKVEIEGTVMIYAKQSKDGAIVNTYTLSADDFFDAGGSPKAHPLEVNGSANYLFVEANIDDATKTADVNTRQGGSKESAVRVTGGNNITHGTPGSCAIEVSPEMARFEVVDTKGSLAKGTSTISKFQIHEIYINNIKTTRDTTGLLKLTNPEWTTAYVAGGTRSLLYDTFVTADLTDTTAYAYNFYPQVPADGGVSGSVSTKEDALKYHPHIVLKVSYDGVANQYLNIVAFKKSANEYFQSFDRGMVYQLELEDVISIIDVVNPPVTPNPDPNAISVEVTVSVKTWKTVAAKPEV